MRSLQSPTLMKPTYGLIPCEIVLVFFLMKTGRSCRLTEGDRPVKASSVFGYLLLAAVAAGVLLNIKDIARYIKISTM